MSFKVHDFEMVTIFLVERDFLFSYLGFNFIYRIELPDSHQNTLCMHYKNIFTTQLYLSTKCKKKNLNKMHLFFRREFIEPGSSCKSFLTLFEKAVPST